MSIILETRSISKSFGVGAAKVSAVDQISLQIRMGEILLIMGPSGSGKTTFLSMLGGLLSADEGEVLIDGVDITQLKPSQLPDIRAKTIGFIFQSFNLLDALTVEENILFPASLLDEKTDSVRQRCGELIRKLGLQDRRKALPQTLSGGEKQRVAIARALAMEPDVLLMDEPFASLDPQTRDLLLVELQLIWQKTKKTIVFVTHNVAEAVMLGTRVLVFSHRPAKIKKEVKIDYKRPRIAEDKNLLPYQQKILAELRPSQK